MSCNFHQRLIFQNAVAGDIARLRFLFAPFRERSGNSKKTLVS